MCGCFERRQQLPAGSIFDVGPELPPSTGFSNAGECSAGVWLKLLFRSRQASQPRWSRASCDRPRRDCGPAGRCIATSQWEGGCPAVASVDEPRTSPEARGGVGVGLIASRAAAASPRFPLHTVLLIALRIPDSISSPFLLPPAIQTSQPSVFPLAFYLQPQRQSSLSTTTFQHFLSARVAAILQLPRSSLHSRPLFSFPLLRAKPGVRVCRRNWGAREHPLHLLRRSAPAERFGRRQKAKVLLAPPVPPNSRTASRTASNASLRGVVGTAISRYRSDQGPSRAAI